MGSLIFAVGLAAIASAVAAFAWVRQRARSRSRSHGGALEALLAAARTEAERIRRDAVLEAREAGHEVRAQAEAAARAQSAEIAARLERVERREAQVSAQEQAVSSRVAALEQAERGLGERAEAARGTRQEAQTVGGQVVARLEQVAGETREELRRRLQEGWIEEAKAQGAALLRSIETAAPDAELTRQAKRMMGIAVQRYQGHYLTERLLGSFTPEPGALDRVLGPEERNLRAIEEVTGIKLMRNESGESIRLEGLDGVGREVARRAMRKLEKSPRPLEGDPIALVKGISQRLDQEIVELGRRAFDELRIAKAHPDIVKLVGRLNYRTSYTQNQWKHAVEVGFLCGMLADELGLDVKLARRAALMHDIGKSLTHAIDGSHAVIGADYARRLGEDEIVANAIGAHHADEPCNSIYAFIVAAADAMSGARPGARREQSDNHAKKLQDLEQIGLSFRGVSRVSAVSGGREIRVYVNEQDVSDARAVEMSGTIARKISDALTFPGQIKVTVIRQKEAIEYAR